MKAFVRYTSRPTRGVPNRTEQRFLDWCEERKATGEFAIVRFEKITLVLASGVRYTPDVWVVLRTGEVVCYEVKGFMQEDARVKLRVAAQSFPEFSFVLVYWKAKAWVFEPVETVP